MRVGIIRFEIFLQFVEISGAESRVENAYVKIRFRGVLFFRTASAGSRVPSSVAEASSIAPMFFVFFIISV